MSRECREVRATSHSDPARPIMGVNLPRTCRDARPNHGSRHLCSGVFAAGGCIMPPMDADEATDVDVDEALHALDVERAQDMLLECLRLAADCGGQWNADEIIERAAAFEDFVVNGATTCH